MSSLKCFADFSCITARIHDRIIKSSLFGWKVKRFDLLPWGCRRWKGQDILMDDELRQFDMELRGLFVETKIEEMNDLLDTQSDENVKALMEANWAIIKKYYDTENFELMFRHYKFVAYSCYLIEYAHQRDIVKEDDFKNMMLIFNDIYELRRKQ